MPVCASHARKRDRTTLRAFELAGELAVLVYPVTAGFPREELYGLHQVNRLKAEGPSTSSGPWVKPNGRQGFSCFGLQSINLRSYFLFIHALFQAPTIWL